MSSASSGTVGLEVVCIVSCAGRRAVVFVGSTELEVDSTIALLEQREMEE